MSNLFVTIVRSGIAAVTIIGLAHRTGEAQRAAADDVIPSNAGAVVAPASLGHTPAARVRPAINVQAEERSSFGGAIIGASLGTLAGIAVGSMIGGRMADCDYAYSETDFCGLGEVLIGAMGGGALGSATGAWIGARSSGGTPSVVWTGLAGFGGVGAGFLAGMLTDRALGVSGRLTVLAYLAGQALLPALVAAGS